MLFTLLWLLTVATVVIYSWQQHRQLARHFADRGVDADPPLFLLGNMARLVFKYLDYTHVLRKLHAKFSHRGVYGVFDLTVPVMMVCDLDLIKQITISDFDHFVDHRQYLPHPDCEPLMGKSLFFLSGDRWRDMRATLTPAFTGRKMRMMMPSVLECSQNFATVLLGEARKKQGEKYVVEMKNLTQRYANDVIASTAFGIKVDSLRERNNIFYRLAIETTDISRWGINTKMLIMTVFPKMCHWLGMRLFSREQHTFFNRMVHDTIGHRERTGIVRPDMIHLLMEARRGYLRYEEETANRKTAIAEGFACSDVPEMGSEDLRGFQKRFWDEADVTAQCFLFLFNGSESTSTMLGFAAYELMINRAVQDRLYAELADARDRLNGEPITYDVLMKLKYLDMVVSETMRKWPPNAFLDRRCTRDITLKTADGRSIQVRNGDNIGIPLTAIQQDPEFYPDPQRFDPERFSEERRGDIKPFTYLALGAGPRNCIGSRFVLMEVKAFLYSLLTTFSFEVAFEEQVPIELSGGGWMMKTKKGINVHLMPRDRLSEGD